MEIRSWIGIREAKFRTCSNITGVLLKNLIEPHSVLSISLCALQPNPFLTQKQS